MISKIEIKNSEVNSGAYINLTANSINQPWECYSTVQGTPKKDIAGVLNTGLARGINTGFNNPTISINGIYKIGAVHATGVSASIDYEYVEDLINRSDIICDLKCDFFVTTTNTTGEIKVMLKNITINNSNTNIVNYTMQFQRVKEE